MFGYIRTFIPELKVRELQAYRAVYCGLCHELRRRYGPFARLTLNYDLTFLALLRLTVSPASPCPACQRRRCPRHPLRRQACLPDSPALAEAADACLIFFDEKLRDTVSDAKGAKKLGAALLRPWAARKRRKAARRVPDVERLAKAYGEAQRAVERKDTPDIDEAAEPTARMLAGLLSLGALDEAARRVQARLGYFMGRYIYLMDAADDLPDDLLSGGYNPFAKALSLRPGGDLGPARERARLLLNSCRFEMERAAALLPRGAYDGVLRNLVTFGLERMQHRVLSGAKRGKREGLLAEPDTSVGGDESSAGGEESGGDAPEPPAR